jgi:hypothetical protein
VQLTLSMFQQLIINQLYSLQLLVLLIYSNMIIMLELANTLNGQELVVILLIQI